MDYYSEEAKKRIESDRAKCEALAEAWRNIERVKTKGGEDFKTLSKNFKNAYIKPQMFTKSEKEIAVYIEKGGKHYSDTINLSRTIYNDSKEAELYKDRLISRGPWMHPYIELTPDEIEQNANERAGYYAKRAEKLGEVLADFEKIAGEVVKLREEAEKLMKDHDIVYYELRAILREENR